MCSFIAHWLNDFILGTIKIFCTYDRDKEAGFLEDKSKVPRPVKKQCGQQEASGKLLCCATDKGMKTYKLCAE